MMFRWDPSQKFISRRRKAWLLVAVGMWVAVGLAQEALNRSAQTRPVTSEPGAESIGVARDYLAAHAAQAHA